jgi:hypothetical protein
MNEKLRITVKDCEELCDSLLRDVSHNADKVSLWKEVWRRLISRLGYGDDPNYELMLPPSNPNEPDSEENRIAFIRGEIYTLLEGRTLDNHVNEPRKCLKVFDRIGAERQ